MADLQVGDRIRVMEPTKVERGFVDCSTVLTVTQVDPLLAYWTTPGGRAVHVAISVAVDQVAD